jgi:probable HAF family extracellular repeat protein
MKRTVTVFFVVISFLISAPAQAVVRHTFVRYTVTDLGTLEGPSSLANGLNASGQVVGYANTSSGCRHAFLYSGNSMQDLGTLGGEKSHALGINNSGQVVGYVWRRRMA